MEQQQILPLQVKADLGVMVMKGYTKLPRAPELETLHQMQFSVIPSTPFWRGYSQCILSPTELTIFFKNV